MMSVQPFTVEFMSGRAAHHVETVLKNAPFAQTRALFLLFHNRSVGIPPEMAVTLAAVVYGSETGKSSNVWLGVENKLESTARAMFPSHSAVETDRKRQRFRLSRFPTDSIFRIVLPLLQRVCVRIKRTVLYCGNEIVDGITLEDYEAYCKHFAIELSILLETDTELPEIFWKSHVLMFLNESEDEHRQRIRFTRLPEAALLLELNPLIPDEGVMSTERLYIEQDHPFKHPHRRRAGVDGAYISQREADHHRMLFSEYLMPDQVRLDRLLNDGFLALQQPPERIQLRDILILGIATENTDSILGAFLKAVWLEVLIQLGRLFNSSRLNKSEFRWIQRAYGTHHVSFATLLKKLGELSGTSNTSEKLRARVIQRSSWYPSIVEPWVKLSTSNISYHEAHGEESSEAWLTTVLGSQMDLPDWNQSDRQSVNRLEALRLKYQASRNTVRRPLELKKFRSAGTVLFMSTNRRQELSDEGVGKLVSLVPNHLGTLIYPSGSIKGEWVWCDVRGRQISLPVNPDDQYGASRLLGTIANTLVNDIVKGLRIGS